MRGRLAGTALAAALCAAVFPTGAQARQVIVKSFDGTPIVAHFCPAAGLKAGQRAPTIMIGPGWGSPGDRCRSYPGEGAFEAPFGIVPTPTFIKRGYNVITWDPRGFWSSGGTAEIDSPDYEGRDAQALIDFVAKQPEAQLDAPGDPRLGMYGASYGGGIQLVTAGLDPRIDAIVPTITWNSLLNALDPAGEVKSGWGLILAGAGVATTTLPGIISPAGIQTGNESPEFYGMLVHGAALGSFTDEQVQWLKAHGPDYLVHNITAPTLLIQGEEDTLFTLDEADRNYRGIKATGTPVKMMWFCGGHGICLTSHQGQAKRIKRRALAWFARYLRGRHVGTGPRFQWVDENGKWRSSGRYPIRPSGSLVGRGSGTLPLVPVVLDPTSGIMIAATPSPVAVSAPVRPPSDAVSVVGAPRLRITYRGNALPTHTYVYAQLVDPRNHLVVNNQATPVPLRLDGQEHKLTMPLVRIASHADPGTHYKLQLAGTTSLFDFQRSAGTVHFKRVRVSLPVVR